MDYRVGMIAVVPIGRLSPSSLRLSFAFGCFLGWGFVLSFLVPVTVSSTRPTAPTLHPNLAFLVGHALCLFVLGLGSRTGGLVRLAVPSLVLCGVLTAGSLVVANEARPLLFLLLGALSAPFTIDVGFSLAQAVPLRERTRVIGIAALVCSTIFYSLGTSGIPVTVVVTVSALAAGLAGIIRQISGARSGGSFPSKCEASQDLNLLYLGSLVGFAICMFFALGALLAMTYPFVFHAGNESLLSYLLSVTATMVVLAVAEWPRRYVAALLAPVVLGISLTLFVTSADCSACVHVRALTRVGVICAGVFLWATMADLAVTIGSRAVFTVGLASVVVSLALGLAAGRVLGGAEVGARLVGYGLTVTALLTAGALGSIAIGGSVWSSPPSSVPLGASVDLVARSLQNRASNSRQSSSRSVLGDRDVIVHRLKAFGLSDREIEVAVPLVHGQKWEEIAETLNISRNTLKSHVRSIYRKTGARNRQGLLLHVLNDDPHEPQ
ncbi:MAG: hypothetical protein KatS3mg060_1117 [Dehalococcoidia bacterium]|nr:MAG: hypothetical protein KatS3mg060_1117 [Dehalococcoidia bacterium]